MLHGFDARTVEFMGWKGKADSELLEAAQGHFDVLLTSDSFMKRHHDLGQGLAIVLVTTNRLREVEQLVPEIADALAAVSPGERLHVPLPHPGGTRVIRRAPIPWHNSYIPRNIG